MKNHVGACAVCNGPVNIDLSKVEEGWCAIVEPCKHCIKHENRSEAMISNLNIHEAKSMTIEPAISSLHGGEWRNIIIKTVDESYITITIFSEGKLVIEGVEA